MSAYEESENAQGRPIAPATSFSAPRSSDGRPISVATIRSKPPSIGQRRPSTAHLASPITASSSRRCRHLARSRPAASRRQWRPPPRKVVLFEGQISPVTGQRCRSRRQSPKQAPASRCRSMDQSRRGQIGGLGGWAGFVRSARPPTMRKRSHAPSGRGPGSEIAGLWRSAFAPSAAPPAAR